MRRTKQALKFFGFWFFVFVFNSLFSTPCQARDRVVAPLSGNIQALSYILMDVETGRVLAARAEHVRRFPASTTKTMTALLAAEEGDFNRLVTIGPNPQKTGESSIYLQQGETLSLRELVEAAMIKSANDSCVAIAEGVAGTQAQFVEMMNRKAREVGAKDTHFVNPHGLHDPNHYSTAYDLALIARRALSHAEINEIIGKSQTRIHGNAKLGAVRVLKNRNRLLLRWDECDGVKTGYTRQAGRCLIASATRVDPKTRRPWRLLSVVMHSPNSWDESRSLLEQGFHKWKPTVLAHGGETLAKLNVSGGSTQVQAVATKEIRLPLRPTERANLDTHIRSLSPEAPVKKDQVVAQLEWRLNGQKIGEVPLMARSDVSKSLVARVIPAASRIMPSSRLVRWTLYTCIILAVLFLTLGLKVRAHERRRDRDRARRYAARRLIG